jgi:hypothetical protein
LRPFDTHNKEKGGDYMHVDFFNKELNKLQKRFNDTFGTLVVCNLTLRYSAILALCWLGVLRRRIKENENRDKARNYIREFVKGRTALNELFSSMEARMKGGEGQGEKERKQDIRKYAYISSA